MSDGYAKAAVLLYSIGEEAATQILSRLDPRVVQKLGKSIAELKKIDKDEAKVILDEFHDTVSEQASMGSGTHEYVKSVMTKMLGPDRAKPVLSRILDVEEGSGIRDLKWMDAQGIASVVKGEPPQIIAAILAHLDRDQAADVLKFLPELIRDDVVLRVALLDGVQPAAFQDLNEALSRIVQQPVSGKSTPKGGVRVAAEMLNNLTGGDDQKVIDRIKDVNPELAQKILDEMFVFDDLLKIDDRGMQAVLRNVEQKALVTSLKGAKPEVKEKIFKNMSARQAEMVQDEMSSMPPMRLADVEAAQKDVVKIVREMVDKGEVTMGGKGEEML